MRVKGVGENSCKDPKAVRVVFRLDDVSAASDDGLDRLIFETFFANQIPLTVGAIPFLSDGDVHDPGPQGELALPMDKLSFLAGCRARGGFEIAQHGCSHQVRAGVDFRTEFCGRAESDQLSCIERGKAWLEQSFPVTSFIPPWNSYDEVTVRVLASLGFRALSADAFGPLPSTGNLQILPATTSLAGLPAALEAAQSARATRVLIAVLMHAYDFRESGSTRAAHDLSELGMLLRGLPRDGRFHYATMEGCAAEGGYSTKSLAPARWRARIARHLPALIRKTFAPEGVALYLKAPRALASGAGCDREDSMP